MSIVITVFPNHQGGVHFLMQDEDSRRVLKQGEFQGEINFSARAVAQQLPELSEGDRRAFLDLLCRVVETWYPEKFSPQVEVG